MSRTSWLKWMLGSTMVISSAFLVYKLWMTKKKKEKELKSEELKQNVDVYDRMLKSTQIVLCETLDECSAALQTILVNDVKEREGTLAYGFDVETGSTGSSTLNDQKDKKDSRVALIQITSLSRTILFRTVKTTILPKILADFLANPNYLKVGVGINNDAKALYQNFRTQMQGCVDLSDLYYKTVKDPKDSKDSKDIAMTKLQKISLQRLVELLLSLQLPKDFRVRCGAWDSAKLSEEQIRYAAADAFYGREVFLALFNRKQGSISWDIQSLKSWSCSKKDLFASHKVQKQRSESSVNQPQEKKGGSQPKKVFDNCRMEDPNGELLALISKKRCDWYLRANLATKRSDQPLTIRLNFKPKGNGYANDTKVSEYYLEPTKNVCVVCGTTQNLCFYSIVPRNLLKQIPNVKAGYDTFIMCSHCHCRSQNAHDSLLGTICTELGLVDSKNPKQTEQRAGYELALEMNRPLGALVFHFRGDHKLPQERLDPLFDLVRQRLHLPSETTITLDHVHAAKVEIPPVDNFYKQMVEHYAQRGQLQELIQRWRQFFLDEMKPAYLSKYWDVTHSYSQSNKRMDKV